MRFATLPLWAIQFYAVVWEESRCGLRRGSASHAIAHTDWLEAFHLFIFVSNVRYITHAMMGLVSRILEMEDPGRHVFV